MTNRRRDLNADLEVQDASLGSHDINIPVLKVLKRAKFRQTVEARGPEARVCGRVPC